MNHILVYYFIKYRISVFVWYLGKNNSPVTAGEINDIILLKFDGHSREYLSIDTVTSTDDAIHYPQEILVAIIRGIFSNWGPESSYDFNFNRKYNKKHHKLRSLIKLLF